MDKITKTLSASIAIIFICICLTSYYLYNKIEDCFYSNRIDIRVIEEKIDDIEKKLSFIEDTISTVEKTENDNYLKQEKDINDLREFNLRLYDNEKDIRSDLKDIKAILRIY